MVPLSHEPLPMIFGVKRCAIIVLSCSLKLFFVDFPAHAQVECFTTAQEQTYVIWTKTKGPPVKVDILFTMGLIVHSLLWFPKSCLCLIPSEPMVHCSSQDHAPGRGLFINDVRASRPILLSSCHILAFGASHTLRKNLRPLLWPNIPQTLRKLGNSSNWKLSKF